MEERLFARQKPEYTGELYPDDPICVKELPPLKMIATGKLHFLALDRTGQVWAMGDDTFGQCGQMAENRQATFPFTEVKHPRPVKVAIPERITKIVCGYNHSLAIAESGALYGWGANNMLQLSNSESYQNPDSPLHAIFEPMKLEGELTGKFVVNASAGEEHTIVQA